MPVFNPDVASRAEKAARHFLAGQTATVTRSTTTRSKVNNKARNKGRVTYKSAGELFDVSEAIVKKYVMLIRDKKALPTGAEAHRPPALTADEDKALNIVVQIADRGHFPLNNASLVKLANQLRDQRLSPPSTSLHRNWPIEWRKKHPEFEFKAASFKDVKRMSAEAQLESLEDWFKEVKAVYEAFNIKEENVWNMDESPFQVGEIKGTMKVLSVKNRARTRRVIFNPSNKESLTAIDAILAAAKSIPSFLIFKAQIMVQGNVQASHEVDPDVVITNTASGYNNAHRALQWIRHFNKHSFKLSPSFDGHTIDEWFGLSPDCPPPFERPEPSDGGGMAVSFSTKPKAHRVLFMDGFEAHEDLHILQYCEAFDIIPYTLPSHTSHVLQPLDVGVYQAVKKAHQKALADEIASGAITINRTVFLNNWKRVKEAGFTRSNIYKGWERTGLWPLKPDVPLNKLREAVKARQEPLFPDLLEAVTPRKVLRTLESPAIQGRIDEASSPLKTWASDVKVALKVSINTQKLVYDWQEHQKRRIEAESQKQNPRKHVAIGDGAHTKEVLDAKVAARRVVDTEEGLKETQRASMAFIKKLALEETPGLKQWPPRKSKAKKKAVAEPDEGSIPDDNGLIGITMDHPEYDAVLRQKEGWDEAVTDDARRTFVAKIWGPDYSYHIPEMKAWKATQPTEWDLNAFLASIEDEEDALFEATGKATLPLMCEDFVPFKTHSKKRARKVRRGSTSSVEIILGDEGVDIPSELPTLPRHAHLVGPSSRLPSTPCPPKKKPKQESRKGKEKAVDTESDEEVATATITVAGKKLEVPASRARVTVTVPDDSSDSDEVEGEDEDELDIVL